MKSHLLEERGEQGFANLKGLFVGLQTTVGTRRESRLHTTPVGVGGGLTVDVPFSFGGFFEPSRDLSRHIPPHFVKKRWRSPRNVNVTDVSGLMN